MMKPCPRGGAFDFENSQIPTLPHLIGGGGGGCVVGTNIDRCINVASPSYTNHGGWTRHMYGGSTLSLSHQAVQ